MKFNGWHSLLVSKMYVPTGISVYDIINALFDTSIVSIRILTFFTTYKNIVPIYIL